MYKTRISTNALTENVTKDILLSQSNRMPVVTTFGAGLIHGLSIFHRAAISVLAGSKVYALPPALPVCSVELPRFHCPHQRQVWSWGKQVLGSHTLPWKPSHYCFPCVPYPTHPFLAAPEHWPSPKVSSCLLISGLESGARLPPLQPNSNSRTLIFQP